MTSVDPRYSEIVSPGLTAVPIAEGFEFTEGPIWNPVGRHVTFSDIPANRLYRLRWSCWRGTSRNRTACALI
jgi:sugar lactone lactonase YvrE